jgi:hypothetical protein
MMLFSTAQSGPREKSSSHTAAKNRREFGQKDRPERALRAPHEGI